MKNKILLIKILSLISFIITIVINALANILPINNLTTKEVSDIYENLLTPAPITFSIWGVIYLTLAIFVIYQLGIFKSSKEISEKVVNKIGILFIISNIANALWIISWHYLNISLSVVLMVVILISLGYIYTKIKQFNLTGKQKLFIQLPFSIYFGWITIATIANITAFLVSINFNGFGISEAMWTVIIAFVGLIIGVITSIKYKDILYAIVFVWAYFGIYSIHVSEEGWNNMYPIVVNSMLIYIIIIGITVGYIIPVRSIKKSSSSNV